MGHCKKTLICLQIVGYRSVREAEDFVGDPIHSLLFDVNSSSTMRKQNRALRREELFNLLNHYSFMLGEELDYMEEVAAAKTYLQGSVPKEDEGVGSSPASPNNGQGSPAFSQPSEMSISPTRGGSTTTTDIVLDKFSPAAPAEMRLLLEEQDYVKKAKVGTSSLGSGSASKIGSPAASQGSWVSEGGSLDGLGGGSQSTLQSAASVMHTSTGGGGGNLEGLGGSQSTLQSAASGKQASKRGGKSLGSSNDSTVQSATSGIQEPILHVPDEISSGEELLVPEGSDSNATQSSRKKSKDTGHIEDEE
jgi:hypothetical protein